MILTLKNIFALNKDDVPRILLISADSNYQAVIGYITDHIKDILIDSYNQYSFVVDKAFNYSGVIDTLNSPSIFSEISYIELFYKTKPTIEHQSNLSKVYTYLSNNLLIIICDSLNKRDLDSKWIQEIKENSGGILVINETCIPDLVTHYLHSYNLTIDQNTITYLIKQNSSNLPQLLQELQRIALYFNSHDHVDIVKIQDIHRNNSKYSIYQLSQAYLTGDFNNSINILNNIYTTTEDAILINWILSEDIKKLIKIKSRLRNNDNLPQIIRELGAWGDKIHHFTLANFRLNYKSLLKVLDMLSKLDLMIKGAINSDPYQQIIKILTQISHS